MATCCDETARLTAGERKARASAKLVHPACLAEAIAVYMDYEALAYWARPALGQNTEPPAGVIAELERRCPESLGTGLRARPKESGGPAQNWEYLMKWMPIIFSMTQTEGWFEAVVIQAHSHPRAIRTREFADRCDELWGSEMPNPYPAFDDWRRNADSYVELPVN
jgi:hypothetical protein